MQSGQLDAYSTEYFHEVKKQVKAIETEIFHIDQLGKQRQKKYQNCLKTYQNYIKKQSALLQRNEKHCQLRNKWYRQQINKCWKTAISNRILVIRSLARTNVMKRDTDEWLARIDDSAISGSLYRKSRNQNQKIEEDETNSMKGSQLIGKYNQILAQYKHRI